MIARPCIRQRLGEFDDIWGKFQQPIFEVIDGLALGSVLPVANFGNAPSSKFNIGRSTFGVGRFLRLHKTTGFPSVITSTLSSMPRSEERRVGKECRYRRTPDTSRK